MRNRNAPPSTRALPARLALLAALLGSLAALLAVWGSAPAAAAVSCPNANPIVNENNCMGEGTTANQSAIENYSEDIGGFTTKSGYELGENVQLKIGTDLPAFPEAEVSVSVYRIGWYGGDGARLIPAAGATNVKVNNSFQCNPENTTTGELSCSNWNVSYTIPGSALPVSGIYEAVFTDVADGGIENYVVFPVRDQKVSAEVLYVLPAATYEAYNTWGCKSLYYDACGGANTIAGDGRAVAVSFERPQAEGENQMNHFFGPDDLTVQWLEEQGYDIEYTDDVQAAEEPGILLHHKVDLISGHSEYWSAASFKNFKAAREAGVSILSLSANTAYWQTRYENEYRTLVCYKTIQGSADGNPGATPNDPAATGPNGEIRPEDATTTRRDPGAPAGNPDAPPGGRIGINEPENSLFGNMYIGDNDDESFKLSIPAGNENGEYSSSRVWRNTGISTSSSTTLPEQIVGWEWDQIPTQASYLAQEPAGVKRVTLTNVSNPEDSFIQDAGRERASTPPPGEAPEVSAVEYRAESGALVFATGTMEWAYAFNVDPVIDQATYNVLTEMGATAATPDSELKVEAPGTPQPPWPSFTATPTTVYIGEPVSFNASASKDPDATITDYKWDFEGSGNFTDTGTTPTTTHTYTTPGTYHAILKVTDSDGMTETTERTINVANTVNAAISASMNPVGENQTDTLSAAGSTDTDGTITDYKWDLNGSGNYETDTGTTPEITKAFSAPGVYTVGVQATDNKGATSTATLSVTVVEHAVSKYSDAVLATPSLLHFYQMNEAVGPTIADSKGDVNGTVLGGSFGVPGPVNGDSDTAIDFPGDGDPFEGEAGSFGEIPINLSSQSAITVEFWLKWDAYGNNDALAMEYTSDYNENSGGFLVDPDSGQYGGTFAVGLGLGATRNNVYFARPSAGVWHHYAIVLNPSAPAASEITPYVDGQPVTYTKETSGTGAGNFANSTLYLFSRDGTSLFGSGSMADLAIYGGELSQATIDEHFDSNGPEPRPVASFTASPNPPRTGQTVTLNGSSSHYADGTITDYKWDLNGSGKYETNTGSTPTTTTSFANPGTYTVGLEVTDSDGATDRTTQQIEVGDFPPHAKLTASPTTALTGQKVELNAGESTDQGTITDYKWSLEGNGKFETDTGTTPTLSTSFQTVGLHTVEVQETDSEDLTSTASVQIVVLGHGVSNYEEAVENTPGLIHYYKLGEAQGPTIYDSKGTSNGTISSATFGLPGAVAEDPTTAIGFNGTGNWGSIPLNLSETGQLTIEFWLKWNQYANNDALAMEFTPNFNENSGGFLVDPNAGQYGGTFGIGIGSGSDRNSIFFARPSAGVWHHYALVINTANPAGSEITPYVDGQPVSFQQEGADTGQGDFANSTLYLFSRDGSTLFGAGELDQLAIYNQPLSAATVFEHFYAHGTAKAPTAAFTLSPNPARPGQQVTLNASGSSAPEGQISEYQWDLNGSGKYETHTTSPELKTSFENEGSENIGLRVIDSKGASASVTHTLTVGNLPPDAKVTASPTTAVAGQQITLNAGESTDQGTITDYKWDLSGEEGKYETNTGTTPTASASFTTPGTYTLGVEVTDSAGLSSRATVQVNVLEQAAGHYDEAIENTPGLIDYYKLDEPQGPTILDSRGVSAGTISGGTFGLPGAIEKSTAIGFNGTSDWGSIPLNLSETGQLTIEFWLKWNQYANNDALAMEFTPNFNENSGGFLVDPNAGQYGGTFGIGIGSGSDRNSIFFARPSAGVWHHYAIVINTANPAGSEITPYVDGQPVSFQQEGADTGQGDFANSTLYLFSRDGDSLFGAGELDELALYNQPLSASTIFAHYHSSDVNTAESPSFTINPTPALTGQNVTFDASASTDTQGTIDDYKWTLEGPGKFESDTGSNPVLTHAFSEPGSYVVALQTTDSRGAVARTTQVLTVTEAPPSKPELTISGVSGDSYVAGDTVYTNPQSGNSGGFTVSASTSDSLSPIENVTFPTLGGFSGGGGTLTSTPYQTTYSWSGAGASASGPQTVTATNDAGLSASSTFEVAPDTTPPGGGALTVNGVAASASGSSSYSTTGSFSIARSEYSEPQSSTQAGLRSSTLTVASAPLSEDACGTFGAPSEISGSPAQSEPVGCYRYTLTGVDNVGNQASVTSTVLVDTSVPTTPSLSFSGLSPNVYYKSSTNTLYFGPSAGGEFIVTATSSDPITGIAGYSFSPLSSYGFTGVQTGNQMAYTFGASATQPPSGPTVVALSHAGASSVASNYALILDNTPPTGGALTVNNVTATAAGSTSYNTSGSFTIGARSEYDADTGSGLLSSVLTRATATLSNGACGSYGTPVTITGTPTQSGLAEGCYLYKLTGTDRVANTASLSTTVEVDKTPPTASVSVPADTNGSVTVTFSATDSGSGVNSASGQLKRATATYTPSTDTCATFSAFSNIGPAGVTSPYTDNTVSTGHCYEYEYTVSDKAGNSTTSAPATVKVNTTKPTLTAIADTTPGSTAGLPQVGDVLTLTFSDPIAASSIPATVTLTYTGSLLSSTTLAVSGIGGSTAWSTGDPLTARYAKSGGTSPVVTANTALKGNSVTLTVTKVSDPSSDLKAGGPGVVTGTLNSSIKDVFGNTASTSSFSSASVKLF